MTTPIPDYEAALARALDAFRQRHFLKALRLFRQAGALEAADHRARHGEGDCLVALHRPVEAVHAFRAALDIGPRYFRAHLNLAGVLIALARFELAAMHAREANRLRPGDPRILEVLGLAQYRLAQYEEAAQSFTEALKLEPLSIDLHCHLHKQLTQLKRTEQADRLMLDLCAQVGWTSAMEKSYRFANEPWFLKNIPTFDRFSSNLRGRTGLRFLEIGSFEGMSACWLLDHVLTEADTELICIDPKFQPPLRGNIERSGAQDRVRLIEGKSQEVLFDLSDDSIDWVYIDGWHVAPQVLLDGLMCWPLLKTGATVIFDDYLKEDQTRLGQPVKLGADLFLRLVADRAEVLDSGRQLVLRKLKPEAPAGLAAGLSALAGCLQPEAASEFEGEGRKLIMAFRDWLEPRFSLPWGMQRLQTLL